MRNTVFAPICAALLVVSGSLLAAPAATVNGVEIPYDRYIAAVESTLVTTNGTEQAAGSAALDHLISDMIVIQLAEKEGVPVTDEQLDKRVKAAEKSGTLAAVMKSRYMTAEEYRQDQRGQQAFINFATKGVPVTDGEVEDFYYKNKDKYNQPEKVRIGVIVAKERTKIDVAAAELAKGTSFADVATKYSEDTVSQPNGGTVGFVFKGQPGVPPVIPETAFTLKVGEASKPVKVEDDWVIVKSLQHVDAVSIPLSGVKDAIHESMSVERGMKDSEVQRKFREAQRSASIEIFVERFKGLGAALKARIEPPK